MHFKLSDFEVNGKKKNNFIVNRKPPQYGYGQPGGCIVDSEISLKINYNDALISGEVTDSDSDEVLVGAAINLILVNSDTLKIYSDNKGFFEKTIYAKIKSICIEYIGYRNLNINFSKH